MTKVYQSVYTYLPFAYFYLASTAVAVVYHGVNPFLVLHRPYTVLVGILVNTAVYRYYKNKRIVHGVIHKHLWKCFTMATYGTLINLIHEMVFHYNHFDDETDLHNTGWSLVYLLFVLYFGYWSRNDEVLSMINIAFLLVPINRTWQVNLHLYTTFVALSVFLLYRNCPTAAIGDSQLPKLPLIRYFCYLRVPGVLVLFGFMQLLVEYSVGFVSHTALSTAEPDTDAAAAIDIATELEIDEFDDELQ